MRNHRLTTDESLVIANLMNQLAEVQMQLRNAKENQNTEIKRLEEENQYLRCENGILKQEQCEWVCLQCHKEFYGPAAIEKGNFKCLFCKLESFCVPKKYLEEQEESDNFLKVAA